MPLVTEPDPPTFEDLRRQGDEHLTQALAHLRALYRPGTADERQAALRAEACVYVELARKVLALAEAAGA